MIISKRATLVGGTAVLLGVGAFAATARSGEPVEDLAAPALAEVGRQDLEVLAEASGTVEPIRTVEVKSKASGEVLRVYVETGDRVEQGALLAEIDPRDVQNALDQAVADLESAQVQLTTSESNRGRMEELRQTNAVTQQEYENAVQSAASARASVVRAQTNLQLARERRNDVTIRAPISGTIISDQVEPGQIIASATSNVSGGSTLFTMADLSEMQVRTLVDETDIGRIRPGQEAQVTVEAYPGRTFRGEVYKVEPLAVVEQNVTTFPVLVHLANPGDLLKPGMNGEVAVQIARRPGALVVPNAAVVGLRDAAATAAALGLDADVVQAALRPGGGAAGGSAAAGGPGAPSEACTALFQRVRAAGGPGGMSEADRAQMQECRQGFEGRRTRGPAAQDGESSTRPGLVFVQGAQGPEPRRVVLGVSDWESTEVLEGLEEGERVIEVAAAQMQARQAQELDRFRQRAGGGILGGGAPAGGRRGG